MNEKQVALTIDQLRLVDAMREVMKELLKPVYESLGNIEKKLGAK